MRPTPLRESAIEKAVVGHAKKIGVRSVKLNGPGDRGKADRMFLRDGRVIFIEFKRPGGKPTALQLKWQREMTALGFTSLIVDSIKDGIIEIERHYGHK